MVFFQIFNFSVLVYKLALFVFQLFLRNDPVVVYALALLLEICELLLLLLVTLLQFAELLAH